jgi:SAM-dependent methyltransferase
LSRTDRDKWNRKYREGAYADRLNPSAFLVECLPTLEIESDRPRGVDIACGIGRNALYLARLGWEVDAIDVSNVALRKLAAAAAEDSLVINCVATDLEADPAAVARVAGERPYDLALVIRYANLPLIRRLPEALGPGGYLIVEKHLVTDADVVGPRDPRFRAKPGELREAAAGFEIVEYRERVMEDPDGRRVALAQLLGRAPD